MASVFDAIEKRNAWPVPGLPGVCVREPLTGETRRARLITDDELRITFAIGVSVVTPSGDREWPIIDGEADIDFAKRIRPIIDDLPNWVSESIAEVIHTLRKPVDVEKLQKKSPEITSPDSPVI